ncbi:TPA: thioredoxin domain-containing protein, partial [Bacillus cereus]|nr:thioredoxin domain-containing protein [Bacillus cereus]
MPNNSKPNSLITEKSPYLLQHAHNPVNWHPWGEEAFEKAKRENKPVLVSIGYSTCHWCHVMAHESFEDEEIAGILNDQFIAIKVDREERPDVDSVYMRICQLMTGQGGWPLNVFVTPDQKPFYVGTYFPKTSKYNRPGFIDVLEHLSETFANDRQHVEDIAENAAAHLEVKV